MRCLQSFENIFYLGEERSPLIGWQRGGGKKSKREWAEDCLYLAWKSASFLWNNGNPSEQLLGRFWPGSSHSFKAPSYWRDLSLSTFSIYKPYILFLSGSLSFSLIHLPHLRHSPPPPPVRWEVYYRICRRHCIQRTEAVTKEYQYSLRKMIHCGKIINDVCS